jgi:hypothetical protein
MYPAKCCEWDNKVGEGEKIFQSLLSGMTIRINKDSLPDLTL